MSACSHAQTCPLFPLLKSSFSGWREYYCDSADRWHNCARYKMSRTGRPVPITLLPNGKDAGHLIWAASKELGTTEPWVPRTAPRPQYDPGGMDDTVTMARYQDEPAPGRPYDSPSAALAPRPQGSPARSKRSLWSRFVDWMSGPA